MIEVKANRDSDDWDNIHTKIQAKCVDPEDLLGECHAIVDSLYSLLHKHDKDLAKTFFLDCIVGTPFVDHCMRTPEDFEFIFEEDEDDECDGDCENCNKYQDDSEEDCENPELFGKYDGEQEPIFRGLYLVGNEPSDKDTED